MRTSNTAQRPATPDRCNLSAKRSNPYQAKQMWLQLDATTCQPEGGALESIHFRQATATGNRHSHGDTSMYPSRRTTLYDKQLHPRDPTKPQLRALASKAGGRKSSSLTQKDAGPGYWACELGVVRFGASRFVNAGQGIFEWGICIC